MLILIYQGAQLAGSGYLRSCASNREYIIPCSESAPGDLCTPTVVSTFINRITLNFPYFGVFAFWAQFAFLGIFAIVLLAGMVWTPRLAGKTVEDEEEDEDEASLIAGGGNGRRRRGVAWDDLRSRPTYGAVSRGEEEEEI